MGICLRDDFLRASYDYLVVGGGTAGLVLAARLSEDPDVVVGVLEAGPDRRDDLLVTTPMAFFQMVGNPAYDWMMRTVPQVRLCRCHFMYIDCESPGTTTRFTLSRAARC